LTGCTSPGNPAPDDVAEALEYLMVEYLGDFQFVSDADRAQALALLLLPFVRDVISGATPMHVIIAPDIGSGKTLLAQAALLPGCGLVPATAPTNNDDEWRKRITSALLGGTSAVLLDNMTKLDSGALAAALTTGTWSDRVLGESREVHLPVRNAWAATGNNLALSPEQARRSAPIFLDPGDVRPADQPRDHFGHADLLGWGMRHRRALVEAALTLVQHWRLGAVAYVEGGYVNVREPGADPRRSRKTLGSFEGWAAVMGGVLEAAGVGGFLENRDRLIAEADDDSQEAREFLAAWWAHSREAVPFAEVHAWCAAGELRDRLPAALHEEPARLRSRLAGYLKKQKGKRAGEYQLVKTKLGGHENPNGWKVVRREPTAIVPAPDKAAPAAA
jgi:putative DNA primase/helicase